MHSHRRRHPRRCWLGRDARAPGSSWLPAHAFASARSSARSAPTPDDRDPARVVARQHRRSRSPSTRPGRTHDGYGEVRTVGVCGVSQSGPVLLLRGYLELTCECVSGGWIAPGGLAAGMRLGSCVRCAHGLAPRSSRRSGCYGEVGQGPWRLPLEPPRPGGVGVRLARARGSPRRRVGFPRHACWWRGCRSRRRRE